LHLRCSYGTVLVGIEPCESVIGSRVFIPGYISILVLIEFLHEAIRPLIILCEGGHTRDKAG